MNLKKAQIEPGKYKNLVVRVSGYSAYFVNLDKELQNEIIMRTEKNKKVCDIDCVGGKYE